MLKAAVIGNGNMGRNHARVYREMEEIELVGLVDANESVVKSLGRVFSAPYFTSVGDLLREAKPDLVSIAVPTVHHFAIAKRVMEAGVHVLLEKPITTTIEQGEELISLARDKGVKLAVGHIERFNPAVMELRRRVREGMAGRVFQILARRLSPYPARIRDAGVVLDLASHDIDLMRYLLGENVVRLYGETASSINSDREDMFNGVMRFKNRTVGVLDVNWMTPRKVRQLTITGGRGMFVCDLLSQELFFYENESAPSQWDQLSVLRGVSEGNIIGLRINRHEPLAPELRDFAQAVRNDRPPNVTGHDGVATLRLAIDFMNSAQTVSVVKCGENE